MNTSHKNEISILGLVRFVPSNDFNKNDIPSNDFKNILKIK
jgi:hypothetical protein